ncbi:prepilin-type N-terminal cleavage/methylation domain-containing protein [Bythopirellula polymerisocia]
MAWKTASNASGFTLVELLVVIPIVDELVALSDFPLLSVMSI